VTAHYVSCRRIERHILEGQYTVHWSSTTNQVLDFVPITRRRIQAVMRAAEIEAGGGALTLPPLAAGPSLARGERGVKARVRPQ
jgi:hypothetical protein